MSPNHRAIALGAFTSIGLAALMFWLANIDPTDASTPIRTVFVVLWAAWLLLPGIVVGLLAASKPAHTGATAGVIVLIVDLCVLAVVTGGINVQMLVMTAFGGLFPFAALVACAVATFALRQRGFLSRR